MKQIVKRRQPTIIKEKKNEKRKYPTKKNNKEKQKIKLSTIIRTVTSTK